MLHRHTTKTGNVLIVIVLNVMQNQNPNDRQARFALTELA